MIYRTMSKAVLTILTLRCFTPQGPLSMNPMMSLLLHKRAHGALSSEGNLRRKERLNGPSCTFLDNGISLRASPTPGMSEKRLLNAESSQPKPLERCTKLSVDNARRLTNPAVQFAAEHISGETHSLPDCTVHPYIQSRPVHALPFPSSSSQWVTHQ
ncbi:hypothetical protein BC629DRAFT_614341 [Irpex lacteus]|nr:hypothetical protein BC629DRAFT_614341 [Irpex lacteus]